MLDDEDDEDESAEASLRLSAGAQPMEYSGFLVKKTGTFSNYKRRFFVLRGGTLLR